MDDIQRQRTPHAVDDVASSMLHKQEEQDTGYSTTNILKSGGFMVLAFMTFNIWSVTMIAAEDILSSSQIPTPVYTICQNLPYFLIVLCLSYFIDKVSLMTKGVVSFLFSSTGILLMALMTSTWLRLVGVALISVAVAVSESGFSSATSFHSDLAIYAFSSGTGFGIFTGAVYFTGLTTSLCVKPSTALLLVLIILPLYPIISWLMTRNTDLTKTSNPTQHGSHVEYTRVGDEAEDIQEYLTWREKLQAAKDCAHLVLSSAIVFFATYLTMQSVVTTIVFKNTSIRPEYYYKYYTLGFGIGQAIGRSYGLALYCLKPSWNFVTQHTWIFATAVVGNLIILILSSWYRFLPSFMIVTLLTFMTGVGEGVVYLNTSAMAGKNTRTRYKEFSRAFVLVALGVGVVVAGLTGLFVEPVLREHCTLVAWDANVCLTRSLYGWNGTVC